MSELKKETEKWLDQMFETLRKRASEKLGQALVSGAIPDYFYEEGNAMLAKVVIQAVEEEHIFKVPYSKQVQSDIDNLLKFI